jgi:hypothetical protein
MKSNMPQRSQRSMGMLKSDAACWDVYVLENKEMFLPAAVQLFHIVSPCSFATHHSPSGVVSVFCPRRNHETPQLSPQENPIHMKTMGLFCNPSTNNGLVAPLHNPAKHPTSTNATV